MTNILDSCGLGQGLKVLQNMRDKGKEKLEEEGLRSKPTRVFKQKKKMVFRPKGTVGLGERFKRVRPSCVSRQCLSVI